jgi:hypothetical protein
MGFAAFRSHSQGGEVTLGPDEARRAWSNQCRTDPEFGGEHIGLRQCFSAVIGLGSLTAIVKRCSVVTRALHNHRRCTAELAFPQRGRADAGRAARNLDGDAVWNREGLEGGVDVDDVDDFVGDELADAELGEFVAVAGDLDATEGNVSLD